MIKFSTKISCSDSEPSTKELKGIAGGGLLNLTGKIAGSGIFFVYTIVIVRFLGSQKFGLFMLGMTIFAFMGFVCRLGIDTGVIKIVAAYNKLTDRKKIHETIVTAIIIICVSSLVVVLMLFLLSDLILGDLLGKPELSEVVKTLSIALPFLSVMHVALGFTQGLKKINYFVYANHLLLPISNLVLACFFLYVGLELHGVILAQVFSIIWVSVVSLFFIKSCFPEIVQPPFIAVSKVQGLKLLRISAPLSLAFFLSFIANWTDTLMIGYLKLYKDVGIYSAAMKTALISSLILVSFNAVFAPFISDLHNKRQIEKLGKLFKIVTRWIFTAGLGAFLFVLLQSRQILFLFGPGFDEGVSCLMILSFAQFVNASVGSVGLILAMVGREKLLMISVFFSCVMNVWLNYVLIPIYGITGAALATGTSTIFLNLLMLFQVYRILGIHPYEIKFIKILLSGGGAVIFMLVFNYLLPYFSSETGLFGQVPVFLCVYTGMLLIWGMDDEDKFLFSLVRQKLKRG